MASRFDDLARREQELAAREASLNAKAEHIRKVGLKERRSWTRVDEEMSYGADLLYVNTARSQQLAPWTLPSLIPRYRHGDSRRFEINSPHALSNLDATCHRARSKHGRRYPLADIGCE